MYVEVVLAKAAKFTDKIYHYSLPANFSVSIGDEVLVPFGRRRETGYVIGWAEKTDVIAVKPILAVLNPFPLFNARQAEFVRWMAQYYCAFLSTTLKAIIPHLLKTNAAPAKPEKIAPATISPSFSLNAFQQEAVEKIAQAINAKKREVFLLHGVTGSGKTEVYLQAAEKVLKQGKSVLVLVPEIALAPQIVQRFRRRFGDIITVLHSDLTLKERREAWFAIKSGKIKIVLGTRLALFAPLDDIGLIVVDEEFETTYKAEQSPRYHAREAAIKLGEIHQGVVVLGSATPSIESYYRAGSGEYHLLTLPERVEERPLPPVEIVDMRKDQGYILSQALRTALAETLRRKEQAILFINRLGYFTFLLCKDCGNTISCPRCAVSLIYDTEGKHLRCNHCGLTAEVKILCPHCQSANVKFFGLGTQRIEKEVGELFPQARILRWDRDATAKRGSHAVFFAAFSAGQADILIGTQMVAKGLDVAKVTLIGVISADTALHLPDFRAAERTFQLLTQVSGRAGRHHLPGKVIIQTYNPEHYAIQAAARQDYAAFYAKELECRRELGYPPFGKLISITVSGAAEKPVQATAEVIKRFLDRRLREKILGPAPATLPKLRGVWRYHLLLKGENLAAMREAVMECQEKTVVPYGMRVAIDVDPEQI